MASGLTFFPYRTQMWVSALMEKAPFTVHTLPYLLASSLLLPAHVLIYSCVCVYVCVCVCVCVCFTPESLKFLPLILVSTTI